MHKEVLVSDIPKLNNIAINAEIGGPIRFKMDGNSSVFAEIVENSIEIFLNKINCLKCNL